jgi:hypothetical protein
MKFFFLIAILFVLFNSSSVIADDDIYGKKPGPGDKRESDPVDGKEPGPQDKLEVYTVLEDINGEGVIHLTYFVD